MDRKTEIKFNKILETCLPVALEFLPVSQATSKGKNWLNMLIFWEQWVLQSKMVAHNKNQHIVRRKWKKNKVTHISPIYPVHFLDIVWACFQFFEASEKVFKFLWGGLGVCKEKVEMYM